ncbi:VOC family protein [Streptomyces dysideae]|uniref:hypothetical protein n=1 Tax=Streptomyces dysideae TaxID=909626 RepID=UPI000AAAD747|nr:hypothetical protein [Streptomyces dysideae]
MANERTFFALGVADAERGRAFYGALFDWTFEPGPTGRGFALSTGGVPGGLHDGDKGASPYLFFGVEVLGTAVTKVRELGGTVTDIGNEGEDDEESVARFGRFKLCRDDQGSGFRAAPAAEAPVTRTPPHNSKPQIRARIGAGPGHPKAGRGRLRGAGRRARPRAYARRRQFLRSVDCSRSGSTPTRAVPGRHGP